MKARRFKAAHIKAIGGVGGVYGGDIQIRAAANRFAVNRNGV
jgi:hypothetical protein